MRVICSTSKRNEELAELYRQRIESDYYRQAKQPSASVGLAEIKLRLFLSLLPTPVKAVPANCLDFQSKHPLKIAANS